MADRMLFVSWGQTVRGREDRALEVFNETVGLYGRLQNEGRIESFDVALLLPGTGLDGFMTITGSAEQLAALKEDAEWRRNLADAELIVDDLKVADGMCNEGVAREMELYREAIAQVPQMT